VAFHIYLTISQALADFIRLRASNIRACNMKNWMQLWPKFRQSSAAVTAAVWPELFHTLNGLYIAYGQVGHSIVAWSARETETKTEVSGYLPVNEAGCCWCE